MSMLDAVIQRLLDADDFRSGTEARVGRSLKLPALPAASLQIIADPRPQHFKGLQPLRPTTVQMDIWAKTAAEAEQLREIAIRVLLPAAVAGGVHFRRAQVTNVRSGADLGQAPVGGSNATRMHPEIFRESIDFIFNHSI